MDWGILWNGEFYSLQKLGESSCSNSGAEEPFSSSSSAPGALRPCSSPLCSRRTQTPLCSTPASPGATKDQLHPMGGWQGCVPQFCQAPRCLSARLAVPPPPAPPALGAAEGHSDPPRHSWGPAGCSRVGTLDTPSLSGIAQGLCLPCATPGVSPHLIQVCPLPPALPPGLWDKLATRILGVLLLPWQVKQRMWKWLLCTRTTSPLQVSPQR